LQATVAAVFFLIGRLDVAAEIAAIGGSIIKALEYWITRLRG
jgi:hypothetical protein